MNAKPWGIVLVVVLCVFTALLWLSTSLHVLEAIARPTSASKVFGAVMGTALDPAVQRVSELIIPEESRSAISGASRWLYASGNEEEAIVKVETNSQSHGWNMRHFAWLTVLTRNDVFTPSVNDVATLAGAIKDIVLNRAYAIQPTVQLRLTQDPGPLSLTGKMVDDEFHFAYTLASEPARTSFDGAGSVIDHDMLEVALPSEILPLLPIKEKNSIEGLIVSDLGFIKSRPKIFETLSRNELIGIGEAQDGGYAVGFADTDSARYTITYNNILEWVEAERGYQNPIVQAFRLPDGTIGQEYIPSKTEGHGFSDPGEDGCRISYVGQQPLWLCAADNTLILGTSSQVVQQLVGVLENAVQTSVWHVSLPEEYASLIPSAFEVSNTATTLKAITIEGAGDSGQGVLSFR